MGEINFGKILDAWEKSKSPTELETQIREKEKNNPPCCRNISLKKIPVEAVLDLHGLTSAEALDKLNDFIMSSKRKGFKKVIIIHGKGIHSKEEPVLKKTVMDFIIKSPYTGAHGIPDNSHGGSGAVWVILK